MSIIEAIKNRRATRNFSPQEVEEDKIVKLLETATWAPNDGLREPWHFYVLCGEALQRYEKIALDYLEERFPTRPNLIQSSLQVIQATPLIIIVTADKIPTDEGSSEDNQYAVCCAIHSMWLAAEELGLGFVWRTRGVGLVRDDRLYQFIGAPENKKIIGTIHIGYPAEEVPPTKRSPYSEKTTWL
jgi:nitroreductase